MEVEDVVWGEDGMNHGRALSANYPSRWDSGSRYSKVFPAKSCTSTDFYQTIPSLIVN